MSLQICIMTPDQTFFNEPADEIILPTNTGQMGVLANHAPLISALDIGVMLIRTQNTWSSIALMGGFALVHVNEAESAKTIQKEEAETTFTNAKLKFEQAEGQKQKVEANFAFKRARARYQLVKEN
jgi:ATP synthase F1 epsilon subunit